MDYETMDWEDEAKRVARAFRLSEECCFKLCEKSEGIPRLDESHVLSWEQWFDEYPLPELEGVFFSCEYQSVRGKSFYIGRFDDDDDCMAGMSFDWNNGPLLQARDTEFTFMLSKGLFHLGLLTPQVEALLHVTIAAHEKLEWTLEYEARYDL